MMKLNESTLVSSKGFVSTGTLPAYIDPQQPPLKKKPFSTILSQPYTHTVNLILPEELHNLVWQDVVSKISVLEYSRFMMSLSELIDGDFFNKYIKSGNILMLSEGRPGIDNQYTLKDGLLRLDLAKETYERVGLVGKPIRDGGRKHVKTRHSVEIDLRQPSMLHGKKGFERIVWAFKNVLNHSVTWLFHDFENDQEEASKPITKHHPLNYTVAAQQEKMEAIVVPPLNLTRVGSSDAELEDRALDIYEWLGLISLQSSQVTASDTTDPYLSRYCIPSADSEQSTPCNMIILSWKAFIPALWIRELFVALVSRCTHVNSPTTSTHFFALSAKAFKTEVQGQQDGYTILCPLNQSFDQQTTRGAHQDKDKDTKRQGSDFLVWEVRDI